MWAPWIVAAIALAGAVFMLSFLIALLREGAPAASYWVTECDRHDYEEFSENEGHAEKENDSGLIVLDVGPFSSGLGCRPIYARGGNVLRERWF
jgi:hypothetical protein